MAYQDTRESSQTLDNRSFNDTFKIYENLIYGFDGTNAAAIKVNTDGSLRESERPHVTYQWSGDLLSKKIAVYADRTETTDYTWSSDKLVEKVVTIT